MKVEKLKKCNVSNAGIAQQRSFFQQCPFERTMDCVIRREILVARSGRFSEIVVARSGGFSDIVVARSGVFRDDW